jgi:hypothetical protein
MEMDTGNHFYIGQDIFDLCHLLLPGKPPGATTNTGIETGNTIPEKIEVKTRLFDYWRYKAYSSIAARALLLLA